MLSATLPHSTLSYDVAGAGDPTVLIHGSLVDHSAWERVRRGLAPALTIVVYDRRGHGASTGDPRRHPVRDDASDLASLLERLDLFPAHLIAHSYGGAVALRLAADRPEMVRSVAVHEPPFSGLLEMDPATAPEAERLDSAMRTMVERVRGGEPERAVRDVVNSLAMDDRAWDRLGKDLQRSFVHHADRWAEEISDPEATHPAASELGELLIPVLVTSGERSPPFLHRISSRLAESVRNSTYRELPGAGHAPHVSDPDLFIATIHGFLVERSVPFT